MTPPSTRAFTLLEILAVVAVVLILAALVFPAVGKFIEKANETKCLANLKTIGSASAAYSGDHNGDWPPSNISSKGDPEAGIPPISANVFAAHIIPYLGRIPVVGDANFMNSPLICPGARTDEPDGSYRHRGIYTTSYEDPDTGKSVKIGLSYAQNVYAPGKKGESSGVPKRLLAEFPSEMMLYMDIEGHYIASVGGVNDENRKRWLLQRHAGKVNVAFADSSVRALNFEDIPSNSPMRRFWSGKGKKWPE